MIFDSIFQVTYNGQTADCKLKVYRDKLIIQLKDNPLTIYFICCKQVLDWDYDDNWNPIALFIHNIQPFLKIQGPNIPKLKSCLNGFVPYKNFYQRFVLKDKFSVKKEYKIYKCYPEHVSKIYDHNKKSKIFIQSQNELEIYKQFLMYPMKHLPKLQGYYYDHQQTILLFEYFKGGTLYEFMKRNQFQLSQKQIKIIMSAILQALAHLHQLGIMHRDIKLDNIMLRHEDDIESLVLIDYGYAVFINNRPYLNPQCGTPGYMAPEVFTMPEYDEKVDIFAAGCLFHILLTGRRLITYAQQSEQLVELSQNYSFLSSSKIDLVNSPYPSVPTQNEDQQPYDLLNRMICKYRLSAAECLRHKYFQQ